MAKLLQVLGSHFSPAQRTLLLVNLASITEKADEALLPAVFQEVSHAFHSSPSALGILTFIRGLVQAATSPLAAYLAQHHNRTHIIGLGAIWWGVATAAVGLSTSYWQLALARAINGVGLAVVLPAIQSVVADSTAEETRGAAFGWLQLTSNSGAIVGGVFATLLAGTSLGFIPGWRLAFFALAIVSVLLGLAVFFFAVDPRAPSQYATIGAQLDEDDVETAAARQKADVKASLAELWAGAKTVVSLRTFQIIIAQGTIGSFPWNAMVFYTLWLELVGYSHGAAAALVAAFSVGTCFGALIGGYLGDFMARKLPNTGRIICSQFSSGAAVPLALVLLHLIPRDASLWYLHGSTLFAMGLLISWNAPATNNPIFAEIVPERLRTSIYAFDRCFETVISAFGSPAVGFMAERFYGYINEDPANLSGPDAAAENVSNARSLANGLFTTIAIPFTICSLTYTLLYFTYPKDRDKARAQALASESRVEVEMSFPEGEGEGGFREQTRLLREDDDLDGSPSVLVMSDGDPADARRGDRDGSVQQENASVEGHRPLKEVQGIRTLTLNGHDR